MKTTTTTTNRTQVESGYETSKFALGVGISSAALIGMWACACMISALMNHGIIEVTKGLFTAIAG